MSGFKNQSYYFFLDACFSGRAGGRTFEGPILKQLRSTKFRGTKPITLKKMELGEGRIMMSACDENQVAREDVALHHGIFTYYLIESLKQSAGKKTISVHTLYEEVASAVRLYTKGKQIPVINGRSRIAQLPCLG